MGALDTQAEDSKTPLSQFKQEIVDSPWGSISKTQLETLIFKFLVDCDIVNIKDSDFDLSNRLKTTSATIRKLKYRYYQQQNDSLNDLNVSSIMESAEINFENASDGYVSVEIENTYLLEYLRQRLREQSAVPRLLSSTIIYVKQDALINVLGAEARKNNPNDRGAVDTNIKALRKLFREHDSIQSVNQKLTKVGLKELNKWSDLISMVITTGSAALAPILGTM